MTNTNAAWFHSFDDEAEDALYMAKEHHDFRGIINLPLPVLAKALDVLQAHYMRLV